MTTWPIHPTCGHKTKTFNIYLNSNYNFRKTSIFVCSSGLLVFHHLIRFYGSEIRASDILSGEVERPNACFALYDVLERHQIMYMNAVEASLKRQARLEAERGMRPRARSASCDMTRDGHSQKQTTGMTEKSNFVSRVKVV